MPKIGNHMIQIEYFRQPSDDKKPGDDKIHNSPNEFHFLDLSHSSQPP